jgi:uncharacterized membrane protein YphA (DoxX/SURF4 family)
MTTLTDRPRIATPAPQAADVRPRSKVTVAVDRLADLLTAHSITILRINLGVVFLVFAAFKYIPGSSPAAAIAKATVDHLTLGVVHGTTALVLTALTETVIGITLITGRFLRVGLCVLAVALVGVLSPLALFPHQMWSGNGPTLMGQYVFKDIVLAAAGLVVAAHALGARLRRSDVH